jgi:hypothetical protein
MITIKTTMVQRNKKKIKRIDKIKEFNVDVTQKYLVFGMKNHMTFHLYNFILRTNHII